MITDSFLETALVQVGVIAAAWLAGYVMRGWDVKHEREAKEREERKS